MHDLEQIKQMMEDHNKSDDRRFNELGMDTRDIKNDIKLMKENHLHHIELSVVEMKADVSWLKKNHWLVAGASVGALITALINLAIKIK